MSERLDAVAAAYDEIAAELEPALAHVRVAAQHYREGFVPRGAAHAWSAHGHLLDAVERLAAQARDHARHSVPDTDQTAATSSLRSRDPSLTGTVPVKRKGMSLAGRRRAQSVDDHVGVGARRRQERQHVHGGDAAAHDTCALCALDEPLHCLE